MVSRPAAPKRRSAARTDRPAPQHEQAIRLGNAPILLAEFVVALGEVLAQFLHVRAAGPLGVDQRPIGAAQADEAGELIGPLRVELQVHGPRHIGQQMKLLPGDLVELAVRSDRHGLLPVGRVVRDETRLVPAHGRLVGVRRHAVGDGSKLVRIAGQPIYDLASRPVVVPRPNAICPRTCLGARPNSC